MTSVPPPVSTFAASKNDILSNIAFYFGDPVVPEKLRDYTEHHAMTYHFPDAYYGQNTRLRETLNNLILKQPLQWHTEVALPFVKIEGTTVEWDEMHFDVRLLQRVPYEGVSRMQTSLRRRHRDRVVRRGIALTIESDFYATEAGRKHFTDQLTSIRYCVQETCNFDVLYAYLTCGNYDFRFDMGKGLRPRRSVRTAMAHEVAMYAIVQKEGLGFDKAVEDCKYRMSRYQVTPNMLIVPPQLLLYLSTAPEEKIRYMDGGNLAVTRFEEGMQGYEARSFRGLGVFTSVPYESNDDSESVQLLQRSTQVGEYYKMHPPIVWDHSVRLPRNYADILVYNEETDMHVHIRFDTAVEACGLREADEWKVALGADTAPFNNSAFYTQLTQNLKPEASSPTVVSLWDDLVINLLSTLGVADPETKAVVEARAEAALKAHALATGATLTNDQKIAAKAAEWAAWELQRPKGADDGAKIQNALSKAVAGGVWVPFCFVLARPFIEHHMLSGIMAVSGRETGATLFGPADMQISANTSVKTIEGHYTCHTKAVVTKEQNVLVMRDIMCAGYVAGGNCKFFGLTKAGKRPGTGTSAEFVAMAKLQMTQRLESADYGQQSMFSFLVPYAKLDSEDTLDQPISVTRRMLPWDAHPQHMSSAQSFLGDDATYTAWHDRFSLNEIHMGEDPRSLSGMDYMINGSANNSLCFPGPHRRYNPWAANFFELVPGQGHFGPDAIPGDARWRRGESVSLAAARSTMTSLEVAAQSQLTFSKKAGGMP